MEFSEGNSHFDLNLFLSFRLTFPEQDKSGVRGGSYQQLTAAVLPPNQKPGGREEPERKKAGRKYCPGHFRGCLPHTEIKGLGVGGVTICCKASSLQAGPASWKSSVILANQQTGNQRWELEMLLP